MDVEVDIYQGRVATTPNYFTMVTFPGRWLGLRHATYSVE